MNQYDDIYDFEDKPKRKRDEDPTTWTDAWKAIGTFAIIAFILGSSLTVGQWLVLGDYVPRYTEMTIATTSEIQSIDFFANRTSGLQNPDLIIMIAGTMGLSALSVVFLIIGLFIFYGLIHIFSSKIHGGEGTLRGLIVRANWWTIGFFATYSIMNTIASSFMIQAIVDKYGDKDILSSTLLLNEFNQAVIQQSASSLLIGLCLWFGWSVSIAFVAAKNYHISKNKGCVAMLLTNVTMVGLYCGCVFGIGLGVAGFMMAA